MHTNLDEEPFENRNQSGLDDRLWIVMKSAYMVLVHTVIIVLLVMAITRHDDLTQFVDGDLYAKRIFLQHGNGNNGVEIGAEHDGKSLIRLNDTEGRARLVLSTDKQATKIDFYSESGSHRATFGVYPNREDEAVLSLTGKHGGVSVGAADVGESLAIFDQENEIIAYIGCAAKDSSKLMLSDKKSQLDLRAPSSDRPFGTRPGPWSIMPVSQ